MGHCTCLRHGIVKKVPGVCRRSLNLNGFRIGARCWQGSRRSCDLLNKDNEEKWVGIWRLGCDMVLEVRDSDLGHEANWMSSVIGSKLECLSREWVLHSLTPSLSHVASKIKQ